MAVRFLKILLMKFVYDSSPLYPESQRFSSIKNVPLITKTDFIKVTQLEILTLSSLFIPLQYTRHTSMKLLAGNQPIHYSAIINLCSFPWSPIYILNKTSNIYFCLRNSIVDSQHCISSTLISLGRISHILSEMK